MTTIHAPCVNFVPAMTSETTPVQSAPKPLITALLRHPASLSESQCLTIPAWERVIERKTPIA